MVSIRDFGIGMVVGIDTDVNWTPWLSGCLDISWHSENFLEEWMDGCLVIIIRASLHLVQLFFCEKVPNQVHYKPQCRRSLHQAN